MNRRWAAGIAAAAALVAALIGRSLLSGPGPGSVPGMSHESSPGDSAHPEAGGAAEAVEAPKVIKALSSSGVPLRVTRTPRIEMPDPPYGLAYQRLREGAETAAPATQYQLGQLLYRCRDAAVDEGDLARQVDQLYQTRRSRGWDVDDPAQEERQLREDYSACAGIPAAERQDYRLWMQRAAEHGLMDAQLNLMFHLPRADYCQFVEDCTPPQLKLMATLRDEARAHVTQSLAAGSVEALRTVGGWYLNEEMGTPDEVEAYAHFSAYDQIQQAIGRERELIAMLSSLQSRLRPVDRERADARAKELLSNPSCCVLTR